MAAQSLSHLGRGAVRVAKNYTKGYSDTQVKIRGATSNDPWGPSGTQMNEIAQMTYSQNEFIEVMEMLDKRLNDKGKNWRHVFKALTLLDYVLHAGSENVVLYFRDNIYIVKTLKEFVYVDEDGKDVGANVRQKAKDITNLLQDEDRLRNERRSRGAMRERMLGNIAESGLRGEDDFGDRDEGRRPPPREEQKQFKPNRNRDEDDDLKRAIEESKRVQDDDDARRRARNQEEDDLRKALALSEEEESKRRKNLEDSNANALFDDGLQMQPQYTSFNPFMQQQQQQEQMMRQQQEEYMRQQMLQQQQQQQQEEYMRQQMMMAEQERQRQEWMQMQQQQMYMQQQALQAQPTGYRSNNPFAPGGSQAAPPPPMPVQPQQPETPAVDFFQPAPVPQQQEQPQPQARTGFNVKTKDTNPELAALWANREGGIDTFGNVGAMRIPVGSAFHESNKRAVLSGAAGGYGNTNPFNRQQQQQQGGASEQPFFQI